MNFYYELEKISREFNSAMYMLSGNEFTDKIKM